MKKVLTGIALTALLAACGSAHQETASKEETAKQDSMAQVAAENPVDCRGHYLLVKKYDSLLMAAVEKDPLLAEKAMKAFEGFANGCPDDTLVPIFLIKGAQVARSVGDFQRSKIMLEKCASKYPKFANRPVALFLLGQLYDDPHMLNDEVKARAYYTEIMAAYGNTPWAKDAEAAINNLGKSDEQLIQEFKKRNSQ